MFRGVIIGCLLSVYELVHVAIYMLEICPELCVYAKSCILNQTATKHLRCQEPKQQQEYLISGTGKPPPGVNPLQGRPSARGRRLRNVELSRDQWIPVLLSTAEGKVAAFLCHAQTAENVYLGARKFGLKLFCYHRHERVFLRAFYNICVAL